MGRVRKSWHPTTQQREHPEAPGGGWRCWLGLSCGQQALVVPVGWAWPEGSRRGTARSHWELGTPSLSLSWFPWPPKGLLIPGWARALCLPPSPLPYLSEIPGDPQADPSRAPMSPLRGAPGACPFSLQSAPHHVRPFPAAQLGLLPKCWPNTTCAAVGSPDPRPQGQGHCPPDTPLPPQARPLSSPAHPISALPAASEVRLTDPCSSSRPKFKVTC